MAIGKAVILMGHGQKGGQAFLSAYYDRLFLGSYNTHLLTSDRDPMTDQSKDCNKGIFVGVTISSMGEVLVTGAGKQE